MAQSPTKQELSHSLQYHRSFTSYGLLLAWSAFCKIKVLFSVPPKSPDCDCHNIKTKLFQDETKTSPLFSNKIHIINYKCPYTTVVHADKNITACVEYFYLKTLTGSQHHWHYWAQVQQCREQLSCTAAVLGEGGIRLRRGMLTPHPKASVPAHSSGHPQSSNHQSLTTVQREEYGFDLGENHKLWSTSTFMLPLNHLFICLS